MALLLRVNPKDSVFWDLITNKISRNFFFFMRTISRKLDERKKACLSLSRRITLIQSCLSHIPSYFLILYKISTSMATKTKKMQKDFLQLGFGEGKKDHLDKANCASLRRKEDGSLGGYI